MQIDVIIVNYKSTDYLIKCLDSIKASADAVKLNILVQDNASEDGVERIGTLYPGVQLQMNTHNMGFAAAVNHAVRHSRAPYIMLLNPDSVVVAGLFDNVIEYMENNPDVGILGPKILDEDGTVQGSARAFPTPLTALFGRTSLFTRLFPNNRITSANLLTQQCDGINPMEVDWVSGACMVVRREAVDAVGLFDEQFFMYWEDADWCKRMWEAGWKVVYYPRSAIIHFVGKSSDKLLARSVFEFHKSVYLLFVKYSHRSYWLMKPIILFGLLVRLCFVFIFSKMNQYIAGRRPALGKIIVAPPGDKGRKIKILRMIARLNIGGPAIHVHLLTRGIDPRRFQTKLVTGKISDQEGDMSYLFDGESGKPTLIPELQREISLTMDVKAWFRIFRLLEHEQPDIVHTHTAKAGFSARFAVLVYNMAFGQQVYVVHTFHGHVFKGYFSPLKSQLFVFIERLIARFTNVIIAISQSQRQELVEKYRIAPGDKVKAIELGFDLQPFLGCKSLKGRFRKHLGVDRGQRVIGIIGRLVPIKNHRMFLEAARIFIERQPEVRVKFVVIGDGELRDYLEAYCRQSGLKNHVIFCGWIKNVPMVYADMDILALTSLNEGTPVSIIEAMAASVPVVATDAGGVRDILGMSTAAIQSNGLCFCERGILTRSNDPMGFFRGIRHLIDESAEQKEARIARARSFVKYRYAQSRLLKDIESLYVDIIDRKYSLEKTDKETFTQPQPHRVDISL